MSWRSFVALGDSFTEGLDDPDPGGMGYRGWADLVARRLAAEAARTAAEAARTPSEAARTAAEAPATNGGEFHYANLAIRGRLFAGVVKEQVPLARAMRPALISFAAGGNDALRRSFDGPALVARYGEVIGELRATGADVILFRSADLTRRLPARRVVLPRANLINEAAADIARRHGAYLVDLWADDELADNSLMWSDDRLHLSTAGHRRVAGHVLRVLGVEPDPDWLLSPGVPAPLSWSSARVADVRWVARYLAPWVKRRLAGRSSGDLVHPKRPELGPVELFSPIKER